MEKAEYQKHFELEESFWWFRGRREVLFSYLRAGEIPSPPLLWFDAGCGTGFNMTAFSRFGDVVGCDFSADALGFCRRRGLRKIVRADVQQLPVSDGVFDAVSLLDVLYHKNIRNDAAVLKDVHRALKPGGLLLVSDSAFAFLRGRHDLAVHGRERYRKKTLEPRLEAAGFEILRMGYFNFFLFPLLFLIRGAERLRGAGRAAVKGRAFAAEVDPRAKPGALSRDVSRRLSTAEPDPQTKPGAPSAAPAAVESDLKPIHPLPNGLLFGILKFEAFLSRRINLPWGSSIVCLARKRR